jgi:hypothetical protein
MPNAAVVLLHSSASGGAQVEGAGHMAPLTHRDTVNALIVEHLSTQLEEVSHAA